MGRDAVQRVRKDERSLSTRCIFPCSGGKFLVRTGSKYIGTFSGLREAKSKLAKHLKVKIEDLPKRRGSEGTKKCLSFKGVYKNANMFEARSGKTYIGRFASQDAAARAILEATGQQPQKRKRVMRETKVSAIKRFQFMLRTFKAPANVISQTVPSRSLGHLRNDICLSGLGPC